MSKDLLKLYLNDFHKNRGAKFVSFAGYNMPISYQNGIIHEHLETRKNCSMFDVSHMGQIIIESTIKNSEILEKIIPANITNLKINKSLYSFILNNRGGIIDDIILSKIIYLNVEYIYIVYNASRKKIDEEIFLENFNNTKILDNNSLIAIQGPKSEKFIEKFYKDVDEMYFMESNIFKYENEEIIISRTGYTGEDGFELSIPNNIVDKFVNELFNYGKINLSGLGSRDSLRLEAGLSLYGNELNENDNPIDLDQKWVISKKRLEEGNFNGFQLINESISNKNNMFKRIGIISSTKSILRNKMNLLDKNNNKIGYITSGGYSPTLKKSIAISLIKEDIVNNHSEVFCKIRNNIEKIILTNLPFINHNYRRKIL